MQHGLCLALRLAVLLALLLNPATPAGAGSPEGEPSLEPRAPAGRHAVIEDFEDGSAPLQSYPDEDYDPNAWDIQSQNTFAGSDYALRMWGNTWKQLSIAPHRLTPETVFQAALYTEELGELHAIGFGDSTGTVLFYCVHGEQLVLSDRWNVVYQGICPLEQWQAYLLSVGRDWQDTWGYLPRLTRIVFVNDRDNTSDGITLFDEIYDVTADLPVAPAVEIQTIVQGVEELVPPPSAESRARLYRVTVQFRALVHDPDSEAHVYHWNFGDGASSPEQNPVHAFTAQADYQFTVALDVADETGLFGRDTCQVAVEPAGQGDTHAVNFAGDVFMGRGYDSDGGLIDTYGVEYLWEPTLEILGNAADVTVVNAECPYTDRGEPHPSKSVVFRTRPENVAGLTYAGVDVVSTGNNHIIDYGYEGLVQTLQVFDDAGLVHGGAGVNAYFAEQPCYFTEEGVRLAFINFCNRTGRQYNEQPFFDAGYDKFGLGYWLEPNNERAIAQAESLADIVIAFPHSGEEYAIVPPRSGGAAGTGEVDPGGAVADVELCPPYVPFDQARDFRFRIWPGRSDRELRRHAVDCGADAVLNSHPHVLQGFEVYNGVLIAHSLGNFMFDLYYPETMPTIVLRARFDKQGLFGWTFKPVFIDGWVPRPASGRLGREILDRMADYSRVLGATVGVDVAGMLGRIFLDPEEAVAVVTESEGAQELRPSGDVYQSLPIELAGQGSLSQILGVAGIPTAGSSVRMGREVLWFGRFEFDEGYHMWSLNSGDEWIADEGAYEGGHCLALHRDSGDNDNVVTVLDRHLPAADSLEYSLAGWMATENAENAAFSLRFYQQRYGWQQIESFNMGTPVGGTTPWRWFAADCEAPDRTSFLNVRASLDAPDHGDAYAWFDDLRVIEWGPWQELTLPLEVPYPNNLRFIQIRTPDSAGSVRVYYAETVLSAGEFSHAVEFDPCRRVTVQLASAAPNPCRGVASLRYLLGARADVSLAIYDVNGRQVARLVQDERQRPGWHRVEWQTQGLPAGIYFERLTVNGEGHSRKMVVVH